MDTKYTHREQWQIDAFARWAEEKKAELDIAVRNFAQGEDGRTANVLKNIASDLMYKMIVLGKTHGIAIQRMLQENDK